MRRHFEPAKEPLRGTVRVPGDKSISHRAVLFAAMSDGTCRLRGVLDSADVRSSIAAVRALGADVTDMRVADGGLDLSVRGWGSVGPKAPGAPVDCGNSGTTARLLLGVLAGYDVEVTLTGDESLSRRPMERVTGPLSRMGASFATTEGGRLPVTVRGAELRAARVELPVASAQVKSAVLLAGTRASGRTVVTEPAPSRDHTERLLPAFGVGVGRDAGGGVWVDGPSPLMAADVKVPGDPSSAAFIVGAALMTPGSEVGIRRVGLNPTRTAFVDVLREMGARIEVRNTAASGAEPYGDMQVVSGAPLRGVTVGGAKVPALIDEVPLLAVVASQAEGTTRFEGVGELRVKESDRLEAVRSGLEQLGVTVRAGDDWLEVDGPARPHACRLDSLGDHRLAMAWAVAALAADGPVEVERWEAVDVSYPAFAQDLASIGA